MAESNRELIERCNKNILEGDIRWQRYWFHEALTRLEAAENENNLLKARVDKIKKEHSHPCCGGGIDG